MYFINNIIGLILKPYKSYSIEQILKNSAHLIDNQTLEEIKIRTIGFIAKDGGFSDRAGRSDVYYSLFGVLVSEAIELNLNDKGLKSYIENNNQSADNQGVYLYSAAIVNYKLFGSTDFSKKIGSQIKRSFSQPIVKTDYHLFLGILSLYIQKEYFHIFKILRKLKNLETEADLPCPVLAAMAVVKKASGKDGKAIEQKLMNFYRGNGSFSALKASPIGDLLSTAVALFALKFINADLRIIKPDCLAYIDSLYENGSFRATSLDFDTDIEYTFYGLLALGALA